jgi:hypothetical protein
MSSPAILGQFSTQVAMSSMDMVGSPIQSG